MATPYEDKKVGRNFCLRYSSDGISYNHRYFYVHKIYIKPKFEQAFERKFLNLKKQRRFVRYRTIEIEILFCGERNEIEDTYNTGYADFVAAINAPYLRIEYNTSIDSECPYPASLVFAKDNTDNVILADDPELEYIDDLKDKPMMKIKLEEAQGAFG